MAVLVTTISDRRPRTTKATFACIRCNARQIVEQHGLKRLDFPIICPPADRGGCGRTTTKFTKIGSESVKTDERWLVVQDLPESVLGNDRPPSKHVRMLGRELADLEMHQGDNIILTGELKEYDEPDSRGGWKVAPETFIECEEIEVLNKTDVEIYADDIERIEEMAKDPDVLENLIIPSIAPHIIGHTEPKSGLAVQMFGGVAKRLGTKEVRGTIHTMLLGDPSTAKTAMVKSIRRMMPRAVYTTLPGSTKVGLTAAAVQIKEFGEGRWVIKAGVLPMANGSIAILDEIGQAKAAEFKAIEECMSEGMVSKAATGEIVNLDARTSILAAGNPSGGSKLDDALKLNAQIEMPLSTWSRFDLFYPIYDETNTDAAMRERLYQYHGLGDAPPEQPIRDEMMRKYISWASKWNPRITEEAAEVLNKAHDDLRALPNSPFTKRTIETLLRISQALARMNLSGTIERYHAEKAVRIHQAGWKLVIDECYGGGGRVDVSPPQSQQERVTVVLGLVQQHEGRDGVPYSKLKGEATSRKISDLELTQALQRLHDDGKVIEKRPNTWGVA